MYTRVITAGLAVTLIIMILAGRVLNEQGRTLDRGAIVVLLLLILVLQFL